ncbi:unnamed protein product, partial [Mesorhabditis spiculigera]
MLSLRSLPLVVSLIGYVNTIQVCPDSACPYAGAWGAWTIVSTCTATCGMNGLRVETRECVSEKFGCPCNGAVSRIVACPDSMCPSPSPTCADGFAKKLNVTSKAYTCQAINVTAAVVPNPSFTCDMTATIDCPRVPLNGIWSAWTNVPGTSCTATCGNKGTVEETRICLTSNVRNCTGISTRTARCPPQPCTTAPFCRLNAPILTFTVNGRQTNRCGYEIPEQETPCFPAGCNVATTTTTTTTPRPTTTPSYNHECLGGGPYGPYVTHCLMDFPLDVGQSFNMSAMINGRTDMIDNITGSPIYFVFAMADANLPADANASCIEGYTLMKVLYLERMSLCGVLQLSGQGGGAALYSAEEDAGDCRPGQLQMQITRTAADQLLISATYLAYNATWTMTIDPNFALRSVKASTGRSVKYSVSNYETSYVAMCMFTTITTRSGH